MKTNEMKIIEYHDGKHSYYRVLVFDTKRRFWRDITSDAGSVGVLVMSAQSIFNDINGCAIYYKKARACRELDRVKMLKNTEYGVMLNAKK